MTDDKRRQLADPKAALDFMFGGNARFTLKSGKTGQRVTYKVMVSDDNPSIFFVYYLTGSDNENDYTYLGMVKTDPFGRPVFTLTRKSKLKTDSSPVKALCWVLGHLTATTPVFPNHLEFWHEGRCCRCGRTLTVPESIESGMGPECAKRREVQHAAA